MIQLNDLGDLLEPFLELLDFFEMVTQLDDRRRLEHPLLIDDELTVLERVDVALDEQEIGARFDGQETRTRDINAVRILKVLDSCTGGGFELKICFVSMSMMLGLDNCTYLDDSLAVVGVLGVDDNFQLHSICFHASLKS
jgi:hypothetical protein